MSVDFWVVAALLTLSAIFSSIVGFMSHWLAGIAMLLMGLVMAGLNLWNQACVRTGGCTVLAWLLVVMYVFFFLFWLLIFIGGMTKKDSGEEDDARGNRFRDINSYSNRNRNRMDYEENRNSDRMDYNENRNSDRMDYKENRNSDRMDHEEDGPPRKRLPPPEEES